MGKRFDGYIRVSRVGGREGDSFISPDDQREKIIAWAKSRGVEIAKFHIDLDQTGGKLSRPGLDAMMQRVKTQQTDGVVVAFVDRLSRADVGNALALVEEIHDAGADFAALDLGIDPTTAFGEFGLTILLALARMQRRRISENWGSAMKRATARGAFPGRTPYGTRRLPNGTVQLDPEQAAIVKRIVTERAAGKGWRSIASCLSRDQITTPNGNSHWAAPTIEGICHSEAAIGVFNGPRGIRVENAWPAMVSRAVWDAAQAIRGKRNDARNYQDRLIAGVARCANCRRTMKRTTNQYDNVSYSCMNKSCSARSSITAWVLDEYVTQLVNERLAQLRFQASEDVDDQYDALISERDNATAEFERWRDDAEMQEIIGQADYRAGLKARADRRDKATVALAEHRNSNHSGVQALDLPENETVQLVDLSFETQQRVCETFLHAAFIRRAKRRGSVAAKDAAERVRLYWSDGRELPELPTSNSGELEPIAW